MAEWTETEQDKITALYKQLKGEYEKKAYTKLFGGPQLQYNQAKSILDDLIKQQNKQGGLESKLQESKNGASASEKVSSNSEYAVWLLGGLAAVLGFATTPLLGAAALFTTTLMMYNNYQNKYKTA